MVALLIGILMSMGMINNAEDFNNFSQDQRESLRIEWIGDENDGF